MRKRAGAIARWSLLALLGIVVAAAVGLAAATLMSRQIGLSSEPLRAGEALAPAAESADPRGRDGGRSTARTDPQVPTIPDAGDDLGNHHHRHDHDHDADDD